jgi:hypothetical protein
MNNASIERRCVVKVSQPVAWWTAFEAMAAEAGMTLSRWMADCAMARLPEEVQRRFGDPRPYNTASPVAGAEVSSSGKTKRSVSLPAGLWVAALRDAERHGVTFSKWIGSACLRRLPDDLRGSLQDRPSSGRPSYRDRKRRTVELDAVRFRVIARRARDHGMTVVDAVSSDADRPLSWVDAELRRGPGGDADRN